MKAGGGQNPLYGWAFLVLCAVGIGCGKGGGNDAGRGDGGNPVTLQAIREGECAWRTRCNLGTCSPLNCKAAIYRAEAAAAAVRCYEKLACDGRDDDCELAAFETTANPEAEIESCMKRYQSSCPQYSDLDVSLCMAYLLLIPSKQAEFNRCFEQSTCAESCLGSVVDLCSS